MLLQTNSYIVPRDKRMEHARLLRKFRQTLVRLGCDHFEVFEQVGSNWNSQDSTGRFVQLMRFRDRRHQLEVQAAERSDPAAQSLIREFCELINFPYQQQEGLFAVGYYVGFMRMPPTAQPAPALEAPPAEAAPTEAEGTEESATVPEIPEMAAPQIPSLDEQAPATSEQFEAPAEEESFQPEPALTENNGEQREEQTVETPATLNSLIFPVPEPEEQPQETSEFAQEPETPAETSSGNGEHLPEATPENLTAPVAHNNPFSDDASLEDIFGDDPEPTAATETTAEDTPIPESSNGEHTEQSPTAEETAVSADPSMLDDSDLFEPTTPASDDDSDPLPSDDHVTRSR